jgi:hypothetical protein
MHLALRTVVTAAGRTIAGVTGTALRTAGRTAFGVLEAASSMELLVIHAKRKILVALNAGKGLVAINQVFQLSSMSLVNIRTELEEDCEQSSVQIVLGWY